MQNNEPLPDPLGAFDWSRIYDRYDSKCRGFQSESTHLRGDYRAQTDRQLYYRLLAGMDRDVDWYEALLYWKLYSQPAAVANIVKWMRDQSRHCNAERLQELLMEMPKTLPGTSMPLSRSWTFSAGIRLTEPGRGPHYQFAPHFCTCAIRTSSRSSTGWFSKRWG